MPTETIEVQCPKCKEATRTAIDGMAKIIGVGPSITCSHCGARFQIKSDTLVRNADGFFGMEMPWVTWGSRKL